MDIKTTAGILAAGAITMGVVDASVLNEKPLERIETVANERVEARQVGDKIETSFPWKDQEGLKVVVDLGEPTPAERLADKRKREVITEVVDFGDGGFKVDILLNEKPDTNRFCYAIEGAENYDFFYQPELTAEEIEQGAERPENIVGSYAVYHKTLKNHVEGQENYATGKAFHIPRPEVWEVNNKASTTEWADLSYDDSEGLCVTARQEFLDDATYPVRIDPTFGYESIGGTEQTTTAADANAAHAYRFTSPSDVGAVSKLTMYLTTSKLFGSTNSKGVIWLQSSLDIVSNGVSGVTAVGTGVTDWHDFTYSTEPSLSASTDYYLGYVAAEGGNSGARPFYDAGTSNFGVTNQANSYSSPTSLSADGTTNRKYSVYATYTAGGPAPEAPSYADPVTIEGTAIFEGNVILQ